MRRFNVTGLCVPEEDYMVDISGKLEQIIKLIDNHSYFTINRARQYGKTTTLACLENALRDRYLVASISFEGIGDESFESPQAFCPMFLRKIANALEFTSASEKEASDWQNNDIINFELLSKHITKMCRDKKVVLMIDEVDKTSNNRVFLHFLGMLRNKFLSRKNRKEYTFHSVILAGVYDIKNIKLKMMNEGTYAPTTEENKIYNSPWNIAVNFNVDMSFGPHEIATMLREYEAEHTIGLDIAAISDEIFRFTGGYPFLVSRICQAIDEELDKDWTPGGVQKAITIILEEKNTLFDDIFKNFENNKNLYDFVYSLLVTGEAGNFTIDDPIINMGFMYGFLTKKENGIFVANKIFEIRILNYFVSKDSRTKKQVRGVLQYDVVKNGHFDMELALRKFAEHYTEIFNEHDYKFLEKQGRLIFLTYLKPLINGQGFFHIESQFTDLRRMDVVVDYGCDQFIIELKLWYGDFSHQEAYEQLLGYMVSKNASRGYLLTFDFRKDENKLRRAEWVDFDGGKRIFDVVL
ncbi:MAG: AAA-like domain-containing protein [Clostridiales bacterium]|jgi:hypothetical protein|nr:AAA-like domain-containing protein [Clostridiales bacterium]